MEIHCFWVLTWLEIWKAIGLPSAWQEVPFSGPAKTRDWMCFCQLPGRQGCTAAPRRLLVFLQLSPTLRLLGSKQNPIVVLNLPSSTTRPHCLVWMLRNIDRPWGKSYSKAIFCKNQYSSEIMLAFLEFISGYACESVSVWGNGT